MINRTKSMHITFPELERKGDFLATISLALEPKGIRDITLTPAVSAPNTYLLSWTKPLFGDGMKQVTAAAENAGAAVVEQERSFP